MAEAITQHFPVAKSRKVTVKKSSKDDKIKEENVEKLSDDELCLRGFDLNYEYGPSQNITRLERWERAEKFNLNPPRKVKELILSNQAKYLDPFWSEYRILD